MEITKKEFEDIFNKCMEADKVYIPHQDEKGNYTKGDWVQIEPKCIIRDFIDFADNTSYPECDTEFNNCKDAFAYYLTLDFCLIMGASGTIWYDNYCKD